MYVLYDDHMLLFVIQLDNDIYVVISKIKIKDCPSEHENQKTT